MRVVIYTPDFTTINTAIKIGKSFKERSGSEMEVVSFRLPEKLFNFISSDGADGFLMHQRDGNRDFLRKAAGVIKRKSPYSSVVVFGPASGLIHLPINGVDLYIPMDCEEGDLTDFFNLSIQNVANYSKNFEKLRTLTQKPVAPILFGSCKYDPSRRMLYHNDKEVKKLSAKEGGIIEVLSMNWGSIVKRELILEKVWGKNDYFSGRSMDVYITHLRKLFRKNEIKIKINNISGVGLILE